MDYLQLNFGEPMWRLQLIILQLNA